MDIMDHIKQAIESNSVILFMKGSPEFPQCGFSARASQALIECGAEFATIDVLAEPEVRANLHRYADWPTFPQLYISGELMGGCDIVMEMFENGDLKTAVEQASK
ncbi:MAG: Grx4 family monothiol glutaredoxin [Proteobacteria bacterium]|nr:Grx4 family monothiol glutaredoxin [Pseudomonadota bacterium]